MKWKFELELFILLIASLLNFLSVLLEMVIFGVLSLLTVLLWFMGMAYTDDTPIKAKSWEEDPIDEPIFRNCDGTIDMDAYTPLPFEESEEEEGGE